MTLPIPNAGADPSTTHGPDARIRIQGNSGCSVRLLEVDGGAIVVEKAAVQARYSERLRRQIEKQATCRASNRLSFIRIPQVLDRFDAGELFHARMEYVYFHDAVEFFSTASRPTIDSVVSMLTRYVDSEIDASPMTPLPVSVLAEKFDAIVAALSPQPVFAAYRPALARMRAALDAADSLLIPVGRCHGDLTFSNIMIARDASAISLIDFLDSFVESPLIDLAKLRQDTLFRWTLLMGAPVSDRLRFSQVMRYIDDQVTRHYEGRPWYRDHIDLILAINMLRIAPYAKEAAVHDFIINALQSLKLTHD